MTARLSCNERRGDNNHAGDPHVGTSPRTTSATNPSRVPRALGGGGVDVEGAPWHSSQHKEFRTRETNALHTPRGTTAGAQASGCSKAGKRGARTLRGPLAARTAASNRSARALGPCPDKNWCPTKSTGPRRCAANLNRRARQTEEPGSYGGDPRMAPGRDLLRGERSVGGNSQQRWRWARGQGRSEWPRLVRSVAGDPLAQRSNADRTTK